MKLKALILLYSLLLGICSPCQGQRSAKAAGVLDKTATSFVKGKGIALSFMGSQKGVLQLQGDKFHLLCGGVESWFDGKTQWSYVAKSEEVTVSTPTPEEVQETNPYALLRSYKKRFGCIYKGTKTLQGKKVHEIELTPQNKANAGTSVILHITVDSYIPQSITLKLPGGRSQIFTVSSFQTGKTYDAKTFCFDAKKYPKAEVIDLR